MGLTRPAPPAAWPRPGCRPRATAAAGSMEGDEDEVLGEADILDAEMIRQGGGGGESGAEDGESGAEDGGLGEGGVCVDPHAISPADDEAGPADDEPGPALGGSAGAADADAAARLPASTCAVCAGAARSSRPGTTPGAQAGGATGCDSAVCPGRGNGGDCCRERVAGGRCIG